MSDRSFGDHTNRNVVKNPLLSSAVTGLSLEDLTHKAVLLPAAPSQTVVTRSVPSGSQLTALGDTDNAPYQSGDANYNILTPTNINPNLTEETIKDEQKKSQMEFPTTETVSKTSQNTQDDFDVNEYFARLQGTRYVSAPLHSHLKDEKATSLQPTEENLEEINLNEPEKVEHQQSLTADIAQNFSQLPNVLPHVANAVFSSFSNMLYKNREQTPDYAKVGFEVKRDEGIDVPLMSVEEVTNDVAPPPKEPSAIGPGSYRITTKKKVYAQIPGLSSGDPQNIPFNTPQPNQNINYFTPEQAKNEVDNTTMLLETSNQFINIEDRNVNETIHCDSKSNLQETSHINEAIPASDMSSQTILPPPPKFANIRGDNQPQKGFLPPSVARRITGNHPVITAHTIPAMPIPDNLFVPAHISDNLTQQLQMLDISSTSVSHQDISRISSKANTELTGSATEAKTDRNVPKNVVQMFIPSSSIASTSTSFEQPSTFPVYGSASSQNLHNIPTDINVMKTPEMDNYNPLNKTKSVSETSNIPRIKETSPIMFSSACDQEQSKPPPRTGNMPYSIYTPCETPLSKSAEETISAAAILPPGSILPPPISNMPPPSLFSGYTAPAPTNIGQTSFQPKPYAPRRKLGPSSSNIAPSSLPQNIIIFNPNEASSSAESNIPTSECTPPRAPLKSIPTNVSLFTSQETKTDEPKPSIIVNPFSVASNVSLFTPDFSQPSDKTQHHVDCSISPTSIHEENRFNQPLPTTPSASFSISQGDVVKPLEPPKIVAGNFRMNKKKPQYYSGPIEGAGSISNNVKPIIPPIEAPSNIYNPQPIPDLKQIDQITKNQNYFSPTEDLRDVRQPEISFGTSHALYDPSKESQTAQAHPSSQAFDITQTDKAPFDLPSPFDLNQTSQSVDTYTHQQTYNTAFDLSRATTEAYEAKHAKGFGLIGSLKSKLSSIDINKIQNTVTTFFDPAYNEPKKEVIAPQLNEPYSKTDQNLQSSFDIFVPTTQQCDSQSYGPNYYQQDSYNYYQNPYSTSSYYPDCYKTAQNHPSYLQHDEALPLLSTSDISRQEVVSEMNQYSLGTHLSTTGQTSAENIPIISSYPDNLSSREQISLKRTSQTNVVSDSFVATQAMGDSAPLISTIPTPVLHIDNSCRPIEEKYKTAASKIPSKNEQTFDALDEEVKDYSKTRLLFTQSPGKSAEIIQKDYIQTTSSSQLNSSAMNIPTGMQKSQNAKQPLLSDPMSAINFFDLHPSSLSSNIGILEQKTSMSLSTESMSNIGAETVKEISKDTSKLLENTTIRPDNLEVLKTTTHTHTPDLITGLFSKLEETEIISEPSYVNSSIMKKDLDTSEDIDTIKHLDVTKVITDLPSVEIFSKFKGKESSEGQSTSLLESITKEEMPIVGVSSVPLFGLSTIIADKSKEITELEDNVKNTSLFEDQNISLFNRNVNVSFFENTGDSNRTAYNEQSNISKSTLFETGSHIEGETRGNINQPSKNSEEDGTQGEKYDSYSENWRTKDNDDKNEDNVTSQLIENITSRIQLQNAVEVPLTESKSTDTIEVDNDQLEEITQIAEETIETIQVHSATELLDDDSKPANYGWKTDTDLEIDKYNYIADAPSSFNFNVDSQTLSEIDYSFKIDPNALGFYGKNSLFFDKDEEENVGNTELQRQISIPSAPPEEEDTKSEGPDVHSIEQDAKKDFPIFEEYVIEPESDISDVGNVQVSDTFTNRVERFKQMEEITDESNIFLTPKSPVTMASYFDTGNYAAEAHYKHTITSPIMRIPPGFEEEYRKMSLGQESCIPRMPGVLIPETSTQTKVTVTNTYTISNQGIGFTVESNISKLLDDKSPISNLPSFLTSSIHQKSDESKESVANYETKPDFTSMFGSTEEVIATPAKSFTTETSFDTHSDKKEEETRPLSDISRSRDLQTLPDPTSFFNAGVDETSNTEEESSFNRLASYFNASPERPEHSKPFFELSQSQNHYRHAGHGNTLTGAKITNAIIPHDRHIANLNLIKDLTSPQNIIVTETIVRTVNYFTVEYENDLINAKINISKDNSNNIKTMTNINTEHENNSNESLTSSNIEKTNTKINDKDINWKITNCEFCCNFVLHDISDINNIKVRTAMNDTAKSDVHAPNMNSPTDQSNRSVTVNFGTHFEDDTHDGVDVLSENRAISEYSPVKHHWFYRVDVEDKSIWRGFSVQDSKALEEAFTSPDLNEQTLVATDGGRYDVNIIGRIRTPVYWSDKPTNVRRCSWFYKGTTDARYVPYTEAVADRLEMEYRHGITTGEWHRRLVLPNNELVVMHGPSVMVHFLHTGSTDGFSAPPIFAFGKSVYRNPPKISMAPDQCKEIDHLVLFVHGAGEYRSQKEKLSASRPRVVRRGHEESEIEDVEPSKVDHLLLLCHGVGSACDMRFRPVQEVVDDFRDTSMQLIQSHYNNSYSNGVVNRIEVLPISWHSTLHSGETGVDRRLAQITLDSIPRLRNFTNDTVLDVLFYTSPVYCQTIIDTVCKELNRIYTLFKQRNPDFEGGVSLGGHSLGSVILYDLLCHQKPQEFEGSSSNKTYVAGSPGTSQPYVKYPQLVFSPAAMYALGSPIAIFECIRGIESLGMDFALPTCKNFFNIFHPYDPIAYRIEPLINPQLKHVKPYLIPHHKGRKRMHLELKETMARVGADIKQKLIESLRTTWNKWKSSSPPTDGQLEKVVEEEMEKEQLREDDSENQTATPDMLGRLNGGRRIDYVLQEAPLEMINEYLFAMTSHVGYWESEDTMLMMLREIYDSLGVQPDSTIPQQSLTVQRTRMASDDPVGDMADPSTSRG